MQGLPPTLMDSIGTVLNLFDEQISLADRATYIRDNPPQAVIFAKHWDPLGPIGTIGKLLEDNPASFEKITYTVFNEATKAMVDADVAHAVSNPVAKASIAFAYAMTRAALPPATAGAVIHAIAEDALAARLGTVSSCDAPEVNTIQADKVAELFKLTKDVLGHLPKTGNESLPVWV